MVSSYPAGCRKEGPLMMWAYWAALGFSAAISRIRDVLTWNNSLSLPPPSTCISTACHSDCLYMEHDTWWRERSAQGFQKPCGAQRELEMDSCPLPGVSFSHPKPWPLHLIMIGQLISGNFTWPLPGICVSWFSTSPHPARCTTYIWSFFPRKLSPTRSHLNGRIMISLRVSSSFHHAGMNDINTTVRNTETAAVLVHMYFWEVHVEEIYSGGWGHISGNSGLYSNP